MVEMDRAIARFKKPVDIIIQTADEYDKNRLIQGTIARYAFLEGKVLYDSHKHWTGKESPEPAPIIIFLSSAWPKTLFFGQNPTKYFVK